MKKKFEPLTYIDYIIFMSIGVFCFFVFEHGDILHTGGSSFAYLNGHILDFYDYNVAYMEGNAYLPSSYILFAIWNIPIRLLGLMTVPSFAAPYGVLMWYKLLPTLVYLGTGFLVYKIAMEFEFGSLKSKISAFVFLTTPIGFYSQFIFGQYDIFTVFLVLLGIYMLLKGKRWQFCLMFGLAITFKYFALLIFVPVLLLVEKDIWKIIKSGIIAVIPFAAEVLIYKGSPAFKSGVFGFNAVGYIGDAVIEIGNYTINIVVLLWALVCAWAYYTDLKERKDIIKWGVFFCNLVVFVVFGFAKWHPQWLLFAVPFWVFASMMNKRFNVRMIIDIGLMFVFTYIIAYEYMENADHYLLIYGAFGKTALANLNNMLTFAHIFPYTFAPAMHTIFVGILAIMTFFSHPKYCTDKLDEDVSKDIWWIRIRFVLGVAIFVVPALYCLIYALK